MIDFIAELGTENASRFILLLEKKPKWLLLVLYLRKKIRLSIREATRLLGIPYSSLKNAIRYLTGRPDREARRQFIATTLFRPLVAVEMLSYREKFLVLTEHGGEFADQVIRLLKRIALKYGRVNIEDELGIPKIEMMKYVAKVLRRHGITDYRGYEERIIDWNKLTRNLLSIYPLLLRVMNTEVIDAVPFEIEISGRKHILYVIL